MFTSNKSVFLSFDLKSVGFSKIRMMLNISKYPKTLITVPFAKKKTEKYGLIIATNPWKVLALCLGLVAACSLGIFRLKQEKNPINLWVPPNSEYKRDTDWILDKFKEGYRPQFMLVTAPNVLEPAILLEVEKIRKKVVVAPSLIENKTLDDLCFRIPAIKRNNINILPDFLGRKKRSLFFLAHTTEDQFDPSLFLASSTYCNIVNNLPSICLEINLPQLWDNNEIEIEQLVLDDVIAKLNSTTVNPVTGHPTAFTDLLGGVKRDESGKIVQAESLLSLWMIHVNFSLVDFDAAGNDAGTGDWATMEILNWEQVFLDIMKNATVESSRKNKKMNIFYESSRSFADISGQSMFQDLGKLFIGSVLMFIYVQAVIPTDYNLIELRLWLGSVGLISIALSFFSTIGLCSIFGVAYGPVHTSLPFLLLGIGVDDMFVIMSHWKSLLPNEKKLPLETQVAITLSHSAVSITVTSLTNMVAFFVGAYTILPCLQSFCIYIAIGILFMYFFQATFFVAFLTIDERRISQRRNAFLPCLAHKALPKTSSSKPHESFGAKALGKLYSNLILRIPIKVAIIILTVILTSFGIYGNIYLKQKFDPKWFLPNHTYLVQYLDQRSHFYPELGMDGGVYIGEINYNEEFEKIHNLTVFLENEVDTLERFDSWTHAFIKYGKKLGVDVLRDNVTDSEFQKYLAMFLWSPGGAQFQKNFRFSSRLICGAPAPKIEMSALNFIFKSFSGPEEYLPAMNYLKKVVKESGISQATVWAKIFGNWVTDEILDKELYRNLGMAMACVMTCSLILIVNIPVCFYIFTCVLLTLLNVAGFMYFWGLYIDIASCVALVLAVGLSVDFAAHIGHTFLVTVESTNPYLDFGRESISSRDSRVILTVKSIGLATVNGALSTLVSFFLLGFSDAYIFQTFFKIFFLVILFGMYHGIVFLPVVLSLIGPPSMRPKYFRDQSTLRITNSSTNGESVKAQTTVLEPLRKEALDVVQ